MSLKVPDNAVEKDLAYYLITTQQSSDLPSTQADFSELLSAKTPASEELSKSAFSKLYWDGTIDNPALYQGLSSC